MNNSVPRLTDSDSALSVRQVEHFAEQWLLSGEISQHSERTIGNRRMIVNNLLWFLRRHKREFLRHAHEPPLPCPVCGGL